MCSAVFLAVVILARLGTHSFVVILYFVNES
jgi:hypothetical protein